MKKLIIIFFALPFFLNAQNLEATLKQQAEMTVDTAKAAQIIRQNIKDFSAALMRQDYDFVTQAYTEDGKIFPANSKILEGHEAIRDYWTPEAGSQNKILYHHITPSEIKILGTEAYDYGYYEGKSTDVTGNEQSWKGKYVIIWKEVQPEVWKMYLDIWNRVK